MSFYPRHRPAPLLDDDEDGGGGNGNGSVPLDSLALLLATAYLLAYLTLHTLTGWASIATAVPLTAAALYHWYHDRLPQSSTASIDREQAELSALLKAAVTYCSDRKKRVQQHQQRGRPVAESEAERYQHHQQPVSLDRYLVDAEAAGGERDESQLPATSPTLFLQLTSPNAHSHPIELAAAAAAGESAEDHHHDTAAAAEDEKAVTAEGHSSPSSEQRRVSSSAVSPPRSTASSTASVLSPKTPTAVLDAAAVET